MLIKTITLIAAPLLAAILVFVFIAGSEAAITAGACVTCHTMHNSQSGVAVNTANAGASQEFLLVNSGTGTVTACWGCHAQSTAVNIYSSIPQISHNATDLAGGNFAYITGGKTLNTGATVSNAGHNVSDTGIAEGTLTVIPGDENSVTEIVVPGAAGTTRLTCSGTTGCHGNRATSGAVLSMRGAHHTADTVLKFGPGFTTTTTQGTTVGLSYRFLLGVKGAEDTDWQATTAATNHNEYWGAIATGTESTKNTNPSGTISGLCAECHGTFHGPDAGQLDSPSPWLRHPTDIVLPNSGEYTGYTSYSFTAPIARQSIAAGSTAALGTVAPGTDTLMCLSCHLAHASPNFKMTRWDYKNATLGTAISGCNVCHRGKN
ncbi:MAG: hypothetical protein Q8K68_02015 [Nitrospirota bacterium]|nr:hypothetical protein [Nitrospirota bacterium]